MTSNKGITCGIPEGRQACKACEDHGKKQPDLVEVVRCKGCKHWRYYCTDPITNYDYGNCHCHQWENAEEVPETTSDDFCSYGVRKEDEGK